MDHQGTGLIIALDAMICVHQKLLEQCGKCSRAGEQYELDRKIEELAGGVEPEEWLTRAAKFRSKAAALRLTLGRAHPDTRAAKEAAKNCRELALALLEARKSRGAAPPAAPKPMIHTPGS